MSNLDDIRDSNGKLPALAWPGLYPLFYIALSGLTVCPDCANAVTSDEVTACDVNWEDADLFCEDCGKRIPSAYAEPDDSARPNLLELDTALGKYEGEIKLTRALWESEGQDDQASFDNGEGCYALYLSLDKDAELCNLGDIRAAILFERSSGFVEGTWYESNAEAQRVWDTQVIPDVYPEDQEDDETDGQ